jgi:hypothetical protein
VYRTDDRVSVVNTYGDGIYDFIGFRLTPTLAAPSRRTASTGLANTPLHVMCAFYLFSCMLLLMLDEEEGAALKRREELRRLLSAGNYEASCWLLPRRRTWAAWTSTCC